MDTRVPNRLMIISLAVVALHVLGGCPRPSPVVPQVDADGGDDAGMDAPDEASLVCAKACAALKKIGCPEAETTPKGDSCVVVCNHTQASKKFDMKPACLAKAETVGDVQFCGTVRCLK